MGAGKIRLSQCMIVKNEEKNIEQALSWGKEIMWEQIVVDTGSTDRTVEIAERMGAKIYHFDWIDDFAAAKNFAIRQASGNWIAFLDADEYMLPEDVEKHPKAIKKAGKLGLEILRTLWIQLEDDMKMDMAAVQYRIFKNNPAIRYIKPIHEQLAYNGAAIDRHVLDASDLSIYHTGYMSSVGDKKARRNIGILLKESEARPEDPDVMGYLGDSYRALGTDEGTAEAEVWYRKALPYIFRSGHRAERDIYTIAMLMVMLYMKALTNAEAEREFMDIYAQSAQYFTGFYDLEYLIGRFYAQKEDFPKGEFHLERAINMMEQYGTKTFNLLLTRDLPETWRSLALCYYQNNKMEKCVNCCVGLLKVDKTHIGTLELLIRCFKNEDPQAVVGFLGKLYNLNDISDRILLLRGAVYAKLDGKGVLKALRQYCTEEELAVLNPEDV